MEGASLLANFLKIMFLITSPVTLLVGLFLLYDLDTYQRIEKLLGKTYGLSSLSRYLIKKLEMDRESFQIFLLKRRRIVGVICILNSLVAIYISLFPLRTTSVLLDASLR